MNKHIQDVHNEILLAYETISSASLNQIIEMRDIIKYLYWKTRVSRIKQRVLHNYVYSKKK